MVVESAGFSEFVEANSSALLRAGWLLTGDWSSAEDLVQTAFAVAWPRWDGLRDRDAAFGYVRTCMIRAFLRDRRRRWTGEVPTDRMGDRMTDQAGDATADADMRESLRAAMQALPERQRAVVVLRYFADLSEQQTAAVLGCSAGAVKSHSARALARLRSVPGLQQSLTGGGS